MLALPLVGLVSWMVFTATALSTLSLSAPVPRQAAPMPVFCAPEAMIDVPPAGARLARGRAAPRPPRARQAAGATSTAALAGACLGGLSQ